MSPVVFWIAGAILMAATLVALMRVERGPSMLDRIVSLDVIIAVLIASTALWSAYSGRVDLVPLLTVMAIVGFVASVTLSRFAASEPEDEGRILTDAEIAEIDAREQAELEDEITQEREG